MEAINYILNLLKKRKKFTVLLIAIIISLIATMVFILEAANIDPFIYFRF